MKKCFNLGALALLGALTFKLILWPIFCCAVSAAPVFRSLAFTQNTENENHHLLESTSMEFNDTNLISHRQTSSIYDIFLENVKNDSSAQKLSTNFAKNKSKRVKEMRSKKLSTLERNERSANLSHITGSARKIQLYIKNRFLQLMPDGVVNGTSDYQSDYTILQRTTVNVGQIKIQGVATCLFLCMDNCGMVYGSVEFTDDCVFNESIEQHHYNTYSSTYNSNAKRTFYLGLNRHGQPRKIQIPASRQLGKLSTYTKSLTQTVSQDRVDQLIARLYGQNHLRHGLKQLCDAGKQLHHLDIKKRKNKLKCNNLGKSNKVGGGGKRKKKKRKCRDDEVDNDQCVINHSSNNSSSTSASVHSSKNVFPATHGNRRKPNNVNNNNNGNSKMCDRDDCNNHNKKNNGNKKRPPKKNNHLKFNNQSISNNKQKSNHKNKTTKISSKDITTLKPDDIDHDIVELTNGSDEFNEDDEYEEFVGGQTANFVDESYFDEN